MNIASPKAADDPGLQWLFVDMNSYFASCEQQRDPALRGKAVVVAPVLADTTCAIAASYAAKAFGIKTGTPIWEAKQRCPGLIVVHAQPKLYIEYHHRILDAIATCIPVETVVSIDEVACRLDRVQRQPDVARALALNVKAAIRDRVGEYLTCSVGIASNRLLAKLASDMQKPDGLIILRPDDLPHAILHLKPQDICGIGHNMVERLRRAGIDTMAALWAADTQVLRRVWGGVTGARFHALLHGADLPSPISPRHSIGHQHVLAPDQRTRDKATPVIRQLLVRAAQRLRDEGFYCQRLMLVIKWAEHLGYHVDESSFHETQDTGFLLQVLQRLWQTAPELRPHRIGVTLAGLKPQTAHQPDLFDRPKPASLTSAVDRLNARFGRGTVSYGTSIPAMTSKIAFTRVPGLGEV